MTIYFSASRNAFYDDAIFPADSLPKDVVPITEATWQSLMSAQAAGQTIGSDSQGNPLLIAAPALTLAEEQVMLCASIDAEADAVYVAIGGPSPGRLAEYQQASTDANAFKAAGYAGAVPITISCWTQSNPGWTNQQAADDIIATAGKWITALQNIRSARLLGKAAVMAATTAGAAQTAVQTAITNIRTAAEAA